MPAMTQRALGAVLSYARKNPLPECGRGAIRIARDTVADQMTPHGPLVGEVSLKKKNGSDLKLEVCMPKAMLHVAAGCAMLSTLLLETLSAYPCSAEEPWSMVVYQDEITPGNVHKQDNQRKMLGVYWTILEFTAAAISKEDFWFVAAALCTATMLDIEGGASQLLGAILAPTFPSSGGLDRAGVLIRLATGKAVRMFIKFRILLADELGLHMSWLCKGSGGTKMCLLCADVFNRNWQAFSFGAVTDSRLQPYTKVHKVSQCRLHTKSTHQRTIAKLGEYREALQPKPYTERESFHGFTFCEYGLLQHPSVPHIIDATEQTMFDWAHCLLQGVLNITLFRFLLKVSEPRVRGYAFNRLHEYIQMWSWPARLDASASARNIFSKKRITSCLAAGIVKFSMSEGLSLIPVLRQWIIAVVMLERQDLIQECKCVLALCLFIQLMMHAARYAVDPNLIEDTYSTFFVLFHECFGEDHMIPKFHYCIHFGDFVRKFGSLLNTLVVERKHKSLLQFMNAVKDPAKLNACIIREVVNQHVAHLTRAPWLDLSQHLVNERPPPRRLHRWLQDEFGTIAQCTYAEQARINKFETCCTGDIVAISRPTHGWFCAQLWFFCKVDTVMFALVDRMTCVSIDKDFSMWSRADGAEMVVNLDDIHSALICSPSDGRTYTVLHPYALRCAVAD